jgi:2,3-bisphosphoglycerate-dependent phosphoglycerate mutase
MSIEIVYETHALTVDNEAGRATGWLDGQLSERGRQLALELGARRRNDGIAVVYTSDLGRAIETAAIAFAGSAIPIVSDERLRECNYGQLSGATVHYLAEHGPRSLDERYPEGESWLEAILRVAEFLNALCDRHHGKRLLLIAHMSTWYALESLSMNITLAEAVARSMEWQPGWEYKLAPTAVQRLISASTTPVRARSQGGPESERADET